ncbi:MAG: beta-ketoacyl-[acyl-carrier-protein] synthase II [Methylophaga sp.]|nr:MAG: beta-ketoacyl-[acyl-carrier-protein] synthase II [Methylophaga sp.]
MAVKQCYLNALGILCALGDSAVSVKKNILAQQQTLTRTDDFSPNTPLELGLYQGDLPEIPWSDNQWRSRNNQFALAAVQQINLQIEGAIQRYGANRVAVIIGTSTSGSFECELAVRSWVQDSAIPSDYDYRQQEMGSPAHFIAKTYGLKGPCYAISTACSSGAKALAAARRLIRSDICDAVITGGVDTLCHLTVQGFSSLEAVSDDRCNPFSKNRKGINIGEGAALFLMTAEKIGIELTGVGEGSDAYHISAPDPTGAGAIRCMSAALKDATVTADEVDYVNLHGTATNLNDHMESLAMYEVFGPDTWCSSTKPFTGHTLAAAGAVEAGICWLALENSIADPFLPVHLWDGVIDPALPLLNFVTATAKLDKPLRYALSNSFAFGGNNISLLLGHIK